MTHTLTDREVLALLFAAPVDSYASGGNGVKPGHVTLWEHVRADDLRGLVTDGTAPAAELALARGVLARVYGLPERARADAEPIVMSLARESDGRKILEAREEFVTTSTALGLVEAAFDDVGSPPGDVGARAEAVCAEVKELRGAPATSPTLLGAHEPSSGAEVSLAASPCAG